MKVRLCALILLLLQVTPVLAQDICSGILRYAARDETQDDQDLAIAQSIYKQNCEGSSSRSSNSTSVGLEAVVKAIPFKFSFGGENNDERLRNFCKTANAQDIIHQTTNLRRSIVVREALNSFVECIRFANQNIFFDPSLGRTRFSISVRRGLENSAIEGVHYNPQELTCTVPRTDGSDTTTTANENTRKNLDVISYPISCERIPKTGQDGSVQYPRAEIEVATNRGNFFLAIPEDEVRPERWATEITAQLNQLEQKISTLKDRLASAVNTSASTGCIRHFEVQICWGEAQVGTEQLVTGSYIHSFSATFPLEFVGEPTINHSVLVNETSAAPAYSVYVYALTRNAWNGALVRTRASSGANPPLLKLMYTAIGRWRN